MQRYVNKYGEWFERFFHPGKTAPNTLKVGKIVYQRDTSLMPVVIGGKTGDRAWPLISDAAGVHPSQVGEAVADARAKGVPTEFTKDGGAVFRSRQHRKEFCKAYGMPDKSGGYGDYTGK